MKHRIGQLVLWVFLFEFLTGPIKEFLETLDFKEAILSNFIEPHTAFLFFTFIIAYGAYSIMVYFIFNYTYPTKKYMLAIAAFIIASFIAVGIRYFLQELLGFWITGATNYKGNYSWSFYYLDNLYYLILYFGLGTIFFFFQYSKYNEEQKNRLELENKKAELAFLRSQINPHFLFNSLNNLYSLVYSKSDKSLKSIEKLSNLLRYSLYDNKEIVPLKKEISYINDFIELEQMRHDFPIALDLNINESLAQHKLPPFLIIPFVENAFKHGVLNDKENSLYFNLNKDRNDLIFKSSNLIKVQNKDRVGGIGLSNVKKRLELLYPNQFELNIDENNNTFKVSLRIKDIC